MSRITNKCRRQTFPVSAIAALTALTFTSSAGAKVAGAGADDTGLEELVVTGFRNSLNAALNTKKQANGVVDQIVAEDIAKFPDQNLAESMQRVPGVSINQDGGEGRQISVRGLGPSYTRVRINGMEAITTLGTTDQDGGANRTRSFDFNVFGSEIFRSLTVRKTASADVDEGSLGATVDLRTSRPFDFNKLTFVASGQGSYNDLAHHTDPRLAVLLSNVFADGKFGALVSAAFSRRNVIEEGASTVRWQSSIGTDTAVPAANSTFYNSTGSGYTTTQLGDAFRPRLPRYDYYQDSQKRLGITASLQFKPGEATDVALDLLYSKYDAGRDESFLEAPSFSATSGTTGAGAVGGVNNIAVTSAAIDSTNSLVYGVFNNVGIRTEQRHDDMTTTFKQATLEGKQKFGDKLTLDFQFGYADSKFDNPVQTTLTWDSTVATGYSYDFRDNSQIPTLSYGSTNVTDPASWKLTGIRLRPNGVDNTYDSGVIDLKWDLADALTWTNGVQYKKFTFGSFERRRSNGTTANQESIVPTADAAIPTSSYANLISVGSLPAGPGSQLTWTAANLGTAAQLMGLYDPSKFSMGIEPILASNFGVEEKDSSAFTQLNFKFPLRTMSLRGDIGLRYVKTQETATGYTFASGSPLSSAVDNTYSDVLPALNMVLDVTDDFLVRFSAAKVMARAGLGSLNPGAVVSVSGNNFSVSAGNPNIAPNRAKTYDFGIEWYPTKGMLVGLTLFYKQVDTYVQTVRTTGPFSANPLGLPDSVAIAACGTNTTTCSPSSAWNFSLPQNTPGGPLKGAELNLQVPFTFLPSFWKSFGVLLNYTYVDANIDYVNNTGAVVAVNSLTELSKNALNGTLYFDNGKFSARVSAAYRSDYLQTIPGRNGVVYSATSTAGGVVGATVPFGNDVEGTKGQTTIDFSTSWTVNDHTTLTFEGQNMTNKPNDQFIDSMAQRTSFYHLSGRQFILGGRYKF